MRYEIVELRRRLKITVVYVTHDQIEAMSMSDRVIVMNNGVVQQVDAPRLVYQNPVNKFVANFIGVANFIPCEIVQRSENAVRVKLLDGSNSRFLNVPVYENESYGENVVVLLRPEDIDVLPSDGGEGIKGILERLIYIGDRDDCVVRFGDVSLRVLTQLKYSFKVGQEVSLVFNKPTLLDA